MNITYLLGAGASYDALPVVKGIPDALDNFAKQFNPEEPPSESKKNIARSKLHDLINEKQKIEYYKKIKAFHKDILWLKSESEKHTSIDTFAKKLYLQGAKYDLKRLKTILSCFFLYLQTKSFDKRYDSFFASILDNLSELPGKIKILSWNYDSQLEIAFSNFSNGTTKEAKSILKMHSKGDLIFNSYEANEFCVYKINGTTNVQKGSFNVDSILADFDENDSSVINSFLKLHGQLEVSNYSPNMTFAWEDFNTEKGFFPNLNHSVCETEILIVIGYSFPFFNRKVDKFILDSMPKLKTIYVQDPNHAEDIIEKIKGIKPWQTTITKSNTFKPQKEVIDKITFIPKKFVDQFFIPMEF